jgi:hypothetical protein
VGRFLLLLLASQFLADEVADRRIVRGLGLKAVACVATCSAVFGRCAIGAITRWWCSRLGLPQTRTTGCGSPAATRFQPGVLGFDNGFRLADTGEYPHHSGWIVGTAGTRLALDEIASTREKCAPVFRP